MPIDPSVYANLGRSQVQPLQALSQFAFAQNALNQNKLFQQTFAARQAMGPLAQASIDPQTGQMDYNKFATLISTHPETAFMAPDIINGLVQRQLTQAQLVNQNLDIAVKRQQAIGSAASGLVAQYGDSVTPQQHVGAVADLVAEGIMPTDKAVSYLSQFGGQTGPALKAHLAQIAAGSLRSADVGSQVLGTFRPDAITNADGSKSPGFSSALFGQVKPATLAGGTYGQAQPGAPGAGAVPSAPPAQGGTGAPPAPSLGGNAPGSQIVSSLSPFQTQRLQDAAAYGKDVGQRQQQANGMVAQLNIVQQYLKGLNTGAFGSSRADIANAMRTLGIAPEIYNAVAGGDLDAVGAARKMFLGSGIQQVGQLIHGVGGGRLAQQETMKFLEQGAPNIDMTPGQIAKVISSARELAHWATLENDYYKSHAAMSQPPYNYNSTGRPYDIGNVQNDWGTVMDRMLQPKGGQ